MLDTGLIKKEKKAPKKSRTKALKRAVKKLKKELSFFDSFNHVAPLNWIPTYYQDQIKAAKPIRIYKSRSKNKKIPLQ